MASNGDWHQGSRVPSFAQMLKKNLPVRESPFTPSCSSTAACFTPNKEAAKLTQITGQFSEPLLSKVVTPPLTAALLPKKIPREFLIKYRRGDLNPISALHQFVQMQRMDLDLKETVKAGNVFGTYFAFCAVIDGVQYKTGLGQNKKEAKANAAKLALDELLQYDEPEQRSVETSGPPLLPVEPKGSSEPNYTVKIHHEGRASVHEKILRTVKEMFSNLISKYPEFEICSGSLAAFVIEKAGHLWEVVAVGTGEFNYKGKIQSDGRLLHDSHAIVTARRSLLRFFYRQLLLFYSKITGDANCTDTRGFEMAIKQRVGDSLTSKLPMFYLVNRPYISLVESVYPVQMDLTNGSFSLNWSQGDICLEVVDGLKGKIIESSPFKSGISMASRLCKAAMLSRFNLVAKEASREDLSGRTYNKAKIASLTYQEAKYLLKSYLEQQGFGSWIVKSSNIEQFKM
ncbi:adenosine deaminase domain-containing protein 1 isoform X3 [Microcaecilia unicolor]|uniref:Adenosine deaminase domain-containing protein 1 n=1 Tax=Microcaecilia unicolor TaxID=1415580 RepID=A0A6P7XAN5_9AMPH|nr:adenosine deaminase domain-containing protein 1 isoform X3 [Microcaecilia unicolor]